MVRAASPDARAAVGVLSTTTFLHPPGCPGGSLQAGGVGSLLDPTPSLFFALPQPFLITKGANPVMYVANNSPMFPFGLPGSSPEDVSWPRRDIFQGNIQLFQDFYTAIMWADPSPFRESQPGQHTEEQSTEEQRSMLHTLHFFLGTLVFSFIKYFDDSTSDTEATNVYMEREWRVLGSVNFALADVHRVFMPENYAERFRADLPDYIGQLTFSDNF